MRGLCYVSGLVVAIVLSMGFSGCVPSEPLLPKYKYYKSAWSDQECRNKNMYPVKQYKDGSVLCGTNGSAPVSNSSTNYSNNSTAKYVSAWSDQECRNKNMYPVKQYKDGSVLCGTNGSAPVSNSSTNYSNNSTKGESGFMTFIKILGAIGNGMAQGASTYQAPQINSNMYQVPQIKNTYTPRKVINSNTYKGTSGRGYQYDMSNGSDKLGYSIDTAAQQRDYYNNLYDTSNNVQQDRQMGQFGGGIY